jgi:hypothetical protein
MYLIAGIAASVKVAKMMLRNPGELIESDFACRILHYIRSESDSVTNVAWSSLSAG